MDANKLLELIKSCKEGDTIVWDEPNGEVYKIKLEKKYPPGWNPKSKIVSAREAIRRLRSRN